MKLTNTLSRTTDEFKPQKDGEASIYSCGPTAYDHIHIGNLRSFIMADTIRRALEITGHNTKHVMNITDIDDKTIARCLEEFKGLQPLEALGKLTEKYTDIFLKDMEAVGNDIQTLNFTNATNYIPQMQSLVMQLVDNGIAYITDDGIYFSIEKYKAAGKKYGQLADITADNTSSARIDNDEYDKEAVHDFALWKKQKTGEPGWDFQINSQNLVGRPGWHIECSAMSAGELGQPFDIHTGGVDLIFPHHENEIAQSTAANGDVLANYFVHNEHLLVEGRKMSKSLNNFYTLEDIVKKGYEPLVFRLWSLQSHYRSRADFSWENLDAAKNRLKQFRLMADLRFQAAFDDNEKGTDADLFKNVNARIKASAEDDLDTPQALASLNQAEAAIVANNGVFSDETALGAFNGMLETADKLFGLQLTTRQDLEQELKDRVAARDKAREAKEWAESDAIRDELGKAGVELLDTPRGTLWSHIND